MVRFFTRYFAWYFASHMNALRIARWGSVPRLPDGAGPLVFYSNHPAWWDGAVYVLLASRLFPNHEHYAPLDAKMLDKYKFFGRIGGYGIDLASARGAAAFLRDTAAILNRRDRAVWIAAQGRFVDVRTRPLALKPGVAHLCDHAPGAVFIPVAIDYAFWTERGSEACIAFGQPSPGTDLLGISHKQRLQKLEAELTRTLDRLNADVIARDPERFDTLLSGRSGVGGIYDLSKGIVARLRGQTWDASHRKGAP